MFDDSDSLLAPSLYINKFARVKESGINETPFPERLGILGYYYLCKKVPEVSQRSKDGMINFNSTLLIKEILKYGFIAGIAGSTIILYIDPSKKAAGGNAILKIVYPTASVISNFALNAWATKNLIDSATTLKSPEEIKETMASYRRSHSSAAKHYGWRIALLTVIGGLTGAVLPTLVCYKEFGNSQHTETQRYIFTALTTLGYTVLTTFSLSETQNLYRWIIRHNPSEKIKNILCHNLTKGLRVINSQTEFPFAQIGAADREITGDLKTTIEQSRKGFNRLLSIARFSQHLPNDNPSWVSQWAKNSLGMFGSGWLTIGWLGYILDSQDEVYTWTQNSSAAWILVIGGSISLLFLSAYIGFQQFTRLYDEITTLISGQPSTSFALQRYPKTTFLLCGISLLVCGFSFPTSSFLVGKYFEGVTKYALMSICGAGTAIFNSYGLLSFVKTLIPHLLANFGNADEKAHADLYIRLNQLTTAIDEMPDEALEKEIKNMPSSTRKILLGVPDEDICTLVQEMTEPPRQKSYWESAMSFFGLTAPVEERNLRPTDQITTYRTFNT